MSSSGPRTIWILHYFCMQFRRAFFALLSRMLFCMQIWQPDSAEYAGISVDPRESAGNFSWKYCAICSIENADARRNRT